MLRNGEIDNDEATVTNCASIGGLASGSSHTGGHGNDGNEKVDGCIYPDEVIMENGVVFNVRVNLFIFFIYIYIYRIYIFILLFSLYNFSTLVV